VNTRTRNGAHRPRTVDTRRSKGLTATEHRNKERLLTQADPSKVRETSTAVVLKHGELFMLSTEGGDVPWRLPHGLGLFYEDCRFLDGYVLTIDGEPPTLLSCGQARGFETYHELANPEIVAKKGGEGLCKNAVAIRRKRLIRCDIVREVIRLRNYAPTPVRLTLELRFRARFEDIFVMKGFVSGPRGRPIAPRLIAESAVQFGYAGRDGIRRTTTIAFTPAPKELRRDRAEFVVSLAPQGAFTIAIVITPREQPQPGTARGPRRVPTAEHVSSTARTTAAEHAATTEQAPAAEQATDAEHATAAEGAIGTGRARGRPSTDRHEVRRWLLHAERIWLARSAELRTSNPLFDRALQQALIDLRLLRSRLDGLHYFAGGIPWFATLFGRDAALVAIQTLPYGHVMARETLQLLARYQARETDAYRDAEPGKILHEFRTGELAQIGAIPQSHAYYGSIDATLLFLILTTEYVNWSGDLALARALRPNLDAALCWIERDADHDGDGYLDYDGRYANGLVNQGWKDSGNAIVNADGSLVDVPVALCEVQAYAYRAWRQTAQLFRALGEDERAGELDHHADSLRARFEREFWSDELGCYVLARQAEGRPAAVVASNSGQVLWGGIAGLEHAARIAERLLEPDMFSGWGIRTLSSREAAYNPMGYHLGSVWPHDNGLIISGLCRYGHKPAALTIFDALFDAASNFRDYRLPELFCGYARRPGQSQPIRYPVACSPQAWAAGALPHALWNLLGLRANALDRRLLLVRPRLPEPLEWLTLSGVRVGDARVDLRFERRGTGEPAAVEASIRDGDLSVTTTEDLGEIGRFA
jgi:glycogen debranching enzyme